MGLMGFEQTLVVTFHHQEGRAGSEHPTTWCLDQLRHLQTNWRLDYSIDGSCLLETERSFAHSGTGGCVFGTVREKAFSDSVFVHQISHSDDDVTQLEIDKGLISLCLCVCVLSPLE